MIEIDGLTFAYAGQKPVFLDFEWRVAHGEAWAVIGPSGCGKSTLLYLVAGLRTGWTGRLLVADQPVTRPRASTGLILQDYGLLPWATVRENVALVMRMGRFYRRKATGKGEIRPYPRADITDAQVESWLDRLGLSHVKDQYPGQVSGGQRQRTAIARSLLLQPSLLLMDEPFSSLDALTREDLQRLTVDLRREMSVTTVVVTHNIEEAVFLGQRILVLGEAPTTRGAVVENPEAGNEGYRVCSTYAKKCAEVRDALAGSRDS